ncbi:hypothetical protein [Chelativorans alearense]|uniref:hypothetical protein n=1 Tax=Chelativorans alearense TaxID=2681495 RepID=UPI0013D6ACBD|nr:hypothetical protein [Chelativorans alearense]
MRELSKDEMDAAAGGVEIYRGFGYGTVPVVGGSGVTYSRSFNNGWSLSAGFSRDGNRGIEVRYVWK